MKNPNLAPQSTNTTSKWPYRSPSHDYILEQMRQNGGDAPLAPHVQNAHILAEQHTYESLSDTLEITQQQLIEAQATVKMLKMHLSRRSVSPVSS